MRARSCRPASGSRTSWREERGERSTSNAQRSTLNGAAARGAGKSDVGIAGGTRAGRALDRRAFEQRACDGDGGGGAGAGGREGAWELDSRRIELAGATSKRGW